MQRPYTLLKTKLKLLTELKKIWILDENMKHLSSTNIAKTKTEIKVN